MLAAERLPPAIVHGALKLKTDFATGPEEAGIKAPDATGSSELAAASGGIRTGQPDLDPCRVLHGAKHLLSRESYGEFPNPSRLANSGNSSGGSMEAAEHIDVAVQTEISLPQRVDAFWHCCPSSMTIVD